MHRRWWTSPYACSSQSEPSRLTWTIALTYALSIETAALLPDSVVHRFHYFVNNIEKMDTLFASSFLKLEDAGKSFTRCGLTRRYLSLIEGPPRRLYKPLHTH